MRSLMRAQLRLALRVAARPRASTLGLLPLLFRCARRSADVHVLGVPLPWLLLGFARLPVCCSASAGSTCAGPSATSGTSPTWCERPVSPTMSAASVVAVAAGRGRHPRRRRLRAADLPHHQRLLRRLAHGRPAPERLRDRRRVPLRRVVPRRRRAGARLRRRHALVPGRLDRRLPRAAGVRRRAAAPLGRLHAAGLRRGPARVAAVRTVSSAARGRDRLALPGAAVPGRRPDPAHLTGAPPWVGGAGRRASSCSSTWSPAACAASPSCRRSSTGSSSPRCSSRCSSCWWSGTATARLAAPRPPATSPTGSSRSRGRARALPDLLADRRDLPRHHGPAARGGALLHQPRRPRRPPHDRGGAGAARRSSTCCRRCTARSAASTPRTWSPAGAPTPWCWSCPAGCSAGSAASCSPRCSAAGAFAAFLSTSSGLTSRSPACSARTC